MPVVVVISQHLLNVFVQLANKRGFQKKKKEINIRSASTNPIHLNSHLGIWPSCSCPVTVQTVSSSHVIISVKQVVRFGVLSELSADSFNPQTEGSGCFPPSIRKCRPYQ
jgi:hypothetical protein